MRVKFLLLLFVFLFFTGCLRPCVDEICFDDSCFELELPVTPADFEKGLMHREYLPEGTGMLFVFDEVGVYSFWMKNTLIPLDLIWLNEDLEVVHIETATPCVEEPCKIYTPSSDAVYTLEINAGLAEKYNIGVGSVASLDLCD